MKRCRHGYGLHVVTGLRWCPRCGAIKHTGGRWVLPDPAFDARKSDPHSPLCKLIAERMRIDISAALGGYVDGRSGRTKA